MPTRFRVAVDKLKKRFAHVADSFRADKLKPELARFVSDTLKTALEMTPVRNEALIEANQRQQYENRINYIPSIHTTEDPTLIISGDDHWLFTRGKWFKASEWRLNGDVYATYQGLLAEHERRKKSISKKTFVNQRKQARFLYQKSWMQVARSLNVPLAVPAQVSRSHTRRKPAKEPPKGYGQWRGGKVRLSAVIYNPFLDEPSRYKQFTGRGILRAAAARNRLAFNRSLSAKLRTSVAYASKL
jgi:hypothetical protein